MPVEIPGCHIKILTMSKKNYQSKQYQNEKKNIHHCTMEELMHRFHLGKHSFCDYKFILAIINMYRLYKNCYESQRIWSWHVHNFIDYW